MNTDKVIFETGATSHAVNDLILFTDTTKELTHSRDIIYTQLISANIKPKWYHFRVLLTLSVNSYIDAFPISHWETTTMSEYEKKEFCQLYANDFETWKSEHGYK